MSPDELSSPQTPSSSPQPEIPDMKIHKSKARFAGGIMALMFVLLIGGTLITLWFLEKEERGTPDVKKEAEQLINEVKKEVSP